MRCHLLTSLKTMATMSEGRRAKRSLAFTIATLVSISLSTAAVAQLPADARPLAALSTPARPSNIPSATSPRNEAPSFVLTAVVIQGSTVFKPDDFAPLYEPYLARRVTPLELAKLAETITDKYRKQGYFLSRAVIPAQPVDSGLLYITVVEGYIASAAVEGSVSRAIQAYAEALVGRRPLRLAELERTLALIGDMGGVTVKGSRIEPDLNDLSAHRLVVTVEIDAVQGSLYSDNRGVEDVGRFQLYTRANLNSVLSDGDQLAIGLFTAPASPQRLLTGEAWYTALINSYGTTLTAYGALSTATLGPGLTPSRTDGDITRASLRVSHPVLRRRNISLWANLGFELRNIESDRFGARMYDDRLRILNGTLNFNHNALNGTTNVYAELSTGLAGLGASKAGRTPLSRSDARSDFLKAGLQLSRYQNIGQTFGLFVAASGQVAADPVTVSEEYAVGGAQFGRAYDYAQISGDHGVSGSVELRYGRYAKSPVLKFYQLYGFYDAGWVWNMNVASRLREASVTSAGVGVRLTLQNSLYLTYEAAWPLTQTHLRTPIRD